MDGRTQSICPICCRPIEGIYKEEKGRMFFVKECPEHGGFRTLAAENAEDFRAWTKAPVINIPPETAQTKGDPDDASCPLHCGACDNHLQTACCVLIDITDRCDQHCPYCFASAAEGAGIAGEPTLEELDAKFELLLELGEERPFNIQLSGGEPAVRDDLPEIISMARQKGFEYVQINTNGRRLAMQEDYARVLKDAGASVIFMQFDGTRDDIYETLRGEPLLEIKKRAIGNCEKAGLPVTLVPTMVEGVNTDDIGEMMDFLVENVNVVKGIHFQPVSFFGRHPEAGAERSDCGTAGYPRSGDFPGRIDMFGLLRRLEQQRPEYKYEDFCPISTGHTLCCFYSTYIREPDGSVRCTLAAGRKQEGISCCDTQSPQGRCCDEDGAAEIGCCGMADVDALDVIVKDRDFVLNKWEIAEPEDAGCCCADAEEGSGSCCGAAEKEEPCFTSSEQITDMDEFLRYYRRNTFTVTGMAFQDLYNMDAERVKRCRVQQLSPDNRLIPFCAYNALYRK